MVRNHVRAAGLGNIGSCHLFRHAMARQMLENGADVRFIQAMLGRADITRTQVYTRVSIRALRISIRLRIRRGSGEQCRGSVRRTTNRRRRLTC